MHPTLDQPAKLIANMFEYRTLAMVALVMTASAVFAQSPVNRPRFDEFEVAAIKPTAPDYGGGRFITMQSVNRFVAKNHTLKTLLAAAYSLTPRAITGGPAWIESDRYDILATTPGDVRPNLDEQMSMLRKLLADRFNKIDFHREPKDLSMYVLMIARNRPRLNERHRVPMHLRS